MKIYSLIQNPEIKETDTIKFAGVEIYLKSIQILKEYLGCALLKARIKIPEVPSLQYSGLFLYEFDPETQEKEYEYLLEHDYDIWKHCAEKLNMPIQELLTLSEEHLQGKNI